MITHITTAHEEAYSDGSKTLGVLLNYSSEIEHDGWKDNLVYIFDHEKTIYIFFNTMFDMFNYLFNGVYKIKCAYMEEDEFDSYYDAPYIEGAFTEKLKWQ